MINIFSFKLLNFHFLVVIKITQTDPSPSLVFLNFLMNKILDEFNVGALEIYLDLS